MRAQLNEATKQVALGQEASFPAPRMTVDEQHAQSFDQQAQNDRDEGLTL